MDIKKVQDSSNPSLFHQADLIQQHVCLSDKNWFKTGGEARFFAAPVSVLEFQQVLSFAHQKKLDQFVLGQGANVLIADQGFDGLIIRPALKNIEIVADFEHTVFLKAGSGVVFHDLIQFCLNHHLLGLEEFSGIPGTVGGSVYINLHYYEFLLEQFLVSAEVINQQTGQIITVDKHWFNFGYDRSALQDKKHFLISATFELKKATAVETAYAQGRHFEIIRHRQRRYPTVGTCGSFFQNFSEQDVVKTDKKLIYVAYYLDQIGVKGELCVGDAIVSHQHANMIVNRGKATSDDIIKLAQMMQEKVWQRFGIVPEPECQLIGFDINPLSRNRYFN